MILNFETLFTLGAEHEYYGGHCGDFNYFIPTDTQAEGRRGRILFKERKGSLRCLFEADGGGAALHPLSNTRLVIGIQLNNPYFANFSNHLFDGRTQLYRNTVSSSALDTPIAVTLSGDYLRHRLNSNNRPNTISLRDHNGNLLDSKTLNTDQTQTDIDFDTRALPNGFYQLQENHSGGNSTTDYYHYPELLKKGVFAIVDLALEPSAYASTASYSMPFQAREETLKYYIVADNYSDSEFNSLSITDEGFSEAGRSKIQFTSFLPVAFTADDIAAELLQSGTQKLAVFKSDSMQKRQNNARKKIQLRKNGDVLIPHLPSPRADKFRPEFVIHVEKP